MQCFRCFPARGTRTTKETHTAPCVPFFYRHLRWQTSNKEKAPSILGTISERRRMQHTARRQSLWRMERTRRKNCAIGLTRGRHVRARQSSAEMRCVHTAHRSFALPLQLKYINIVDTEGTRSQEFCRYVCKRACRAAQMCLVHVPTSHGRPREQQHLTVLRGQGQARLPITAFSASRER